jgi:hypothetical protein
MGRVFSPISCSCLGPRDPPEHLFVWRIRSSSLDLYSIREVQGEHPTEGIRYDHLRNLPPRYS